MSGLYTPLPERKRTYRVALTPLADAMFQLLIFFMLTTSLTPYSLITLKSASEDIATEPAASPGIGGVDETPQQPNRAESTRPDVTIWSLEDGSVTVSGLPYQRDQLLELAEAVGSDETPGNVVILVGETAKVQDLAAALEALGSASVAGVQILTESSQ